MSGKQGEAIVGMDFAFKCFWGQQQAHNEFLLDFPKPLYKQIQCWFTTF